MKRLLQPGRAAGLLLVPVLTAAWLAAPASAHDFWVEPEEFAPSPGTMVAVGLWSGDGFAGQPVPRSAARMARFAILGAAGDEAVRGVDGTHPAGFFNPGESGSYWVVYETRPRRLTLGAERFERYLRSEGLERIVALRAERSQSDRPGRESYRRCAKSRVVAGGVERPVGGATAGCPLELFLEPPSADAADVSLRLVFQGRPLIGARIAALRRGADGAVLEGRTDDDGRVRFAQAAPGVWLFKAVHMEAAPEGLADVDWLSWWASLTVSLPSAPYGSR